MTIHLSQSLVNTYNPAQQTHFKTIPFPNFTSICDMVTSAVWSPILWDGGLRQRKAYMACNLIVLDFDTGRPTIAAMAEKMKAEGLRFFIGTTKSHGVEKITPAGIVKPACDRYRLAIATEPLADTWQQYTWQMAKIMQKFPSADGSCKDGARYFFPCREIVIACDGRAFRPPKPPKVKVLEQRVRSLAQKDVRLGRCGILPPEIKAFLRHGAFKGERRPSLFKYAARLKRLGWNDLKIIEALTMAPFDRTGIDEDEITRHIQRGIKVAYER